MTKYYCDRCGQLCENSKKRKEYQYHIHKYESMFSLDLCDECQRELEDWMDNKENKLNDLIKDNPAKNVKSPLLSVKNIFG